MPLVEQEKGQPSCGSRPKTSLAATAQARNSNAIPEPSLRKFRNAKQTTTKRPHRSVALSPTIGSRGEPFAGLGAGQRFFHYANPPYKRASNGLQTRLFLPLTHKVPRSDQQPRQLPSCQGGVPKGRGGSLIKGEYPLPLRVLPLGSGRFRMFLS